MTPLIEGTQPEGLTTQELAERLDKTPQTIRNWMAEGMPYLFKGTQRVPSRFDEDACRRWIAANKSGLGRGGTRERAGRPGRKRTQGKRAWRNGPEPLLEDAEKKHRARERLAELAATSGAEAAVDPEVVELGRDLCKLTRHDLVLMAHLAPEATGLTGAAVARLDKLETIQQRQIEREKAMGRLLAASDVREAYARLFGELRQAIDAMPAQAAREVAAALELDGAQHKRAERVLKERAEALVAALRDVGEQA